MDDFDLVQLHRNPQWRITLQVYFDKQQALELVPESDGWVPRQTDIEGLIPAQLSAIHGKLIAYGLLKVDVSSRDVGMRYQVTPQGRRALLGETSESWSESA